MANIYKYLKIRIYVSQISIRTIVSIELLIFGHSFKSNLFVEIYSDNVKFMNAIYLDIYGSFA